MFSGGLYWVRVLKKGVCSVAGCTGYVCKRKECAQWRAILGTCAKEGGVLSGGLYWVRVLKKGVCSVEGCTGYVY